VSTKQIIYLSRIAGFVLVCIVALVSGITPPELVWGLYISSMVSGAVALIVPLWLLLFIPSLERKLFPSFPEVEFSRMGRIFTGLLLLAIFLGPFLLFMGAFTPFLVEAFPVAGMPESPGW